MIKNINELFLLFQRKMKCESTKQSWVWQFVVETS